MTIHIVLNEGQRKIVKKRLKESIINFLYKSGDISCQEYKNIMNYIR